MSDIIESFDRRIFGFFKYCENKFSEVGFRISFPKDTDPKKTYKWRYLEHFVRKVDEWEISDDTACQIIGAMVDHAANKKQLKKGLSLLASDQILEIGYKSIRRKQVDSKNLVETIKKDVQTVHGQDPLGKTAPRALPNVVKWHIQNKVSDLYLTVSKSCRRAISELDEVERDMLPSGKEFLLLRRDALSSIPIKHQIKWAMGDDWEEL